MAGAERGRGNLGAQEREGCANFPFPFPIGIRAQPPSHGPLCFITSPSLSPVCEKRAQEEEAVSASLPSCNRNFPNKPDENRLETGMGALTASSPVARDHWGIFELIIKESGDEGGSPLSPFRSHHSPLALKARSHHPSLALLAYSRVPQSPLSLGKACGGGRSFKTKTFLSDTFQPEVRPSPFFYALTLTNLYC